MRKITVLSMITLDGIMQSPGGATEDPSNGFNYGGWVANFSDEVYGNVVREELRPAAYLLGRKTYEIWAPYWPGQSDLWPGVNEGAKYVFSNTLKNSDPIITGWKNAEVISTLDDIIKLKESAGPGIQVWGSGELVQLLLENDLVDELRLKIHPLTLGQGKKLFAGGSIPAAFKLTDSIVTPTGVAILVYQRAGEIKLGTSTIK